jgi:hypothetical protein
VFASSCLASAHRKPRSYDWTQIEVQDWLRFMVDEDREAARTSYNGPVWSSQLHIYVVRDLTGFR